MTLDGGVMTLNQQLKKLIDQHGAANVALAFDALKPAVLTHTLSRDAYKIGKFSRKALRGSARGEEDVRFLFVKRTNIIGTLSRSMVVIPSNAEWVSEVNYSLGDNPEVFALGVGHVWISYPDSHVVFTDESLPTLYMRDTEEELNQLNKTYTPKQWVKLIETYGLNERPKGFFI
ncbi:hypothetical protein [Ralstonia phage phiRSL1]|uniref:Uncharacterized protein n=1 Tax=Ralstonia phage phiRSL1 TaxID=1980924 RepID=B2ZXP0_9CAUD|nr:hypothetical protein RSL1_ORF021 [Ralstonia phage phiRSL1]BAG41465.1 hypothetical protein [Ralstonia phage phiRSL1]